MNRKFRRPKGFYKLATTLLVLSGVFLLFSCKQQSEWIDLIDEDLSGWTLRYGTATFEVVDGVIIGTTPAEESPSSFLCTNTEYADFELEFETRIDTGFNSGVQIRSKLMTEADAAAMIESMSRGFGGGPAGRPGGPPDAEEEQEPEADTMEADTAQEPPPGMGGGGLTFSAGRVFGPQVEIAPNREDGISSSGYIFGEGLPTFWITPDEELEPHAVFRNGEWNQYRVLAQGSRIQVWVNGEQISDLTDEEVYEDFQSGFIGLQVHTIRAGTGPYQVEWRNLRIRPVASTEE